MTFDGSTGSAQHSNPSEHSKVFLKWSIFPYRMCVLKYWKRWHQVHKINSGDFAHRYDKVERVPKLSCGKQGCLEMSHFLTILSQYTTRVGDYFLSSDLKLRQIESEAPLGFI